MMSKEIISINTKTIKGRETFIVGLHVCIKNTLSERPLFKYTNDYTLTFEEATIIRAIHTMVIALSRTMETTNRVLSKRNEEVEDG